MEEVADELRRRTGVRTDPKAVGSEIREALRATPLRWMPGARTAIDRLRRRGLRLGVVSNILHEPPEIAHDVLARPGAPGPFGTIVVSSEGPYAKPAPEIIWQALTALDVPPAEALHIGDSTADLLAADRAGVRFVRFRGTPPAPRPGPSVARGGRHPPSIHAWSEFPSQFDRLWDAGGRTHERVVRRARSARARPDRRAAARTPPR
ncbi:MAG TPA: HAD-IA family hydrolase, partial [Thermoplasmata archaeon]|nr:HAD-IA family hydrolase [Thermoplasmata archaeon]